MSCSLDVIPVHPSRVNAVKNAEKPIERGPSAPGYFKKIWLFNEEAGGTVYDPTRIIVQAGIVGLKPLSAPVLQKKKLAPHQLYGKDRATFEIQQGARYLVLDSFKELIGPNHKGVLRYQLSPNGSIWYFHDGQNWVQAGAGPDQANTAQEINAKISNFDQEAGRGSLRVKVLLISPNGTERAELQGLETEGVSPKSDHWD